MPLTDLSPYFLINFPHEKMRLYFSLYELKRVTNRKHTRDDLNIIIPTRFTAADKFDSVGVKSCTISHLEAVKRAKENKLPKALIMEDDIFFSNQWIEHGDRLLQELDGHDWDMAIVGYSADFGAISDSSVELHRPEWMKSDHKTFGSHFYLLNSRFYKTWIDYLELVISGKSDHPDAQTIGIDGAMHTITRYLPETKRLVVSESIVDVRPNVSSITPKSLWKKKYFKNVKETYYLALYFMALAKRKLLRSLS